MRFLRSGSDEARAPGSRSATGAATESGAERTAHLIYRLAPSRSSVPRPNWFDVGACLRSFIASVEHARDEGFRCRVSLVLDGDVDMSLADDFDWFDEVERIDCRGNSRSFRHVLAMGARSPEPVLLLAEDDYLWTAPAVAAALGAVVGNPQIHYASPFSHGAVGGHPRTELRARGEARFELDHRVWRSVVDTTMTFAVRRVVLADDFHYWWLASYGKSPKDIWAFAAILEGRWFRLVGNAAYRDWRRVANWATLRLVGECCRRRLRPARRPLLVQPMRPLAIHVHGEVLAEDPMWRTHSEGFRSPGVRDRS